MQDLQLLVLDRRARRVSTATTLCLFLTALMVMSIGIIGGVYLYRQYARTQMHRFRGWCSIPYEVGKPNMYMSDTSFDAMREPLLSDSELFKTLSRENDVDNIEKKMGAYFKEEFELGLDEDNYEKIDVPDFRGGRNGRFIHDFNSNKTGIIDMDGHRCFVMPLNRGMILPPRSLFDLIRKMWDGYYEVNTDVVRETMRVTTPPITDLSSMGLYIAKECNGLPTYQLEKDTSKVFKRSAELHDGAKFAQFAGNNILELDIVNFEELQDYESKVNAL